MKKYRVQCFKNREFQYYVDLDSRRKAVIYAAHWLSDSVKNQVFISFEEGQLCLFEVWDDEHKEEL